MTFYPDAATVYADGPWAYPYGPEKSMIRALLAQYEAVMNGFTTNAGLIYTSLAAMNAAATLFTEPRSAWLFDGANSGVYVLNPTTDTWTKVGRLPYDFIIGTDLGAGTANAIQITTDIPAAEGMIVAFSLFEATTGSPITVSINGGAALTLKTPRDTDATALGANQEVWFRIIGSDARMINDSDIALLVDRAEAAQTASETARAGAETAEAGAASAQAAAEVARDQAVAATASKMDKSASLSDVSNAVLARQNIGLGNAFSIDPALAYRGFSEIDGVWTIVSATAANVDGYMRMTTTGLDLNLLLEGLSISGAANRYVAIRYRVMNGVRDSGVYWATTAHPVIDGAYRAVTPADGGDGVWQTAILDMWNPALGGTGWKDGTVTALRFDFASEIGAVVDVAWIAICADAIPLGASETASMKRDMVPDTDGGRKLGSTTKGWLGYFKDILLSGAAGTVRTIKLATAGSPRWKIGMGSGAENGGNAGSTFFLARCDDTGADIENCVVINRPDGVAYLNTPILNVQKANGLTMNLKTTSTAIGQEVDFSMDPSGTGVRGAIWKAKNPVAATATVLELWIANAADPVKALTVGSGGVFDFVQRPTWNGVGLATVNEIGGGGTSGVASFNGRSGLVTSASGDYTAAQISYSGGNVEGYLGALVNRTQFVSPAEYGLIGDGTTDNSAAWASMMTALASSHPDGATIIWPAKNYYFASDITQSAPHNHVGVPNLVTNSGKGTRWSFGATASFVINKQNGGKYSGIAWLKAAQGTHLVRWKQATVEGESGSTYITFEDCYMSGECTVATLYMTNCLLILFDKCRFFNSYKGAACKVVWLDGSQFGVAGNVRSGDNVDNIEFKTCIATGYQMVSTSDYAVEIDGWVIDGKAHSTKFSQCKALYCYYGVALLNSGPTTDFPKFTRFAQGGMENCYKNAIKANKGDLTVFSDMYASLDSSVDSGTVYGNTDVVIADTTYIGTLEFIGCQIRGGKRNAYRLEGGRTQITGGQCANSAIRTTGYSVDILSTVDGVIMQGVDCRTMVTGNTGQSYAIRNLATSDIIVNGCNLKGYTAAFQSGGTGAGITGNLT